MKKLLSDVISVDYSLPDRSRNHILIETFLSEFDSRSENTGCLFPISFIEQLAHPTLHISYVIFMMTFVELALTLTYSLSDRLLDHSDGRLNLKYISFNTQIYRSTYKSSNKKSGNNKSSY
jgi:hypothetical protein